MGIVQFFVEGDFIIFCAVITIISFLFSLICVSRASYWKGKFESLQENQPDNSGWREEAHFLRRLLNRRAATEAEQSEKC